MPPPTLGSFIVIELATLKAQNLGIEFRREMAFPWRGLKQSQGVKSAEDL